MQNEYEQIVGAFIAFKKAMSNKFGPGVRIEMKFERRVMQFIEEGFIANASFATDHGHDTESNTVSSIAGIQIGEF